MGKDTKDINSNAGEAVTENKLVSDIIVNKGNKFTEDDRIELVALSDGILTKIASRNPCSKPREEFSSAHSEQHGSSLLVLIAPHPSAIEHAPFSSCNNAK
jgi:hypothetical protein